MPPLHCGIARSLLATSNMKGVVALSIACCIIVLTILVDYRLSRTVEGVLAVPLCFVALVYIASGIWIVVARACSRNSERRQGLSYWFTTAMIVLYLIANHVRGILTPVFNENVRVVSGEHLLRTLGLSYTAVVYFGLKPPKAW
jgi:fucose 4-O-acetylase-like acetyltransferase